MERLILHNISAISCRKSVLKIRAKCKSANMGSSIAQLNDVDLIDIQVQNWL